MLLYTWKDIERKFLLEREKWEKVIVDIETYVDEVIIYLNEMDSKISAQEVLFDIFEKNYDNKKNQIYLDISNDYLSITYEIEENDEQKNIISPLFKNILYQESAYSGKLLEQELPGVPVLAFHSYKGGVGRTLSL